MPIVVCQGRNLAAGVGQERKTGKVIKSWYYRFFDWCCFKLSIYIDISFSAIPYVILRLTTYLSGREGIVKTRTEEEEISREERINNNFRR